MKKNANKDKNLPDDEKQGRMLSQSEASSLFDNNGLSNSSPVNKELKEEGLTSTDHITKTPSDSLQIKRLITEEDLTHCYAQAIISDHKSSSQLDSNNDGQSTADIKSVSTTSTTSTANEVGTNRLTTQNVGSETGINDIKNPMGLGLSPDGGQTNSNSPKRRVTQEDLDICYDVIEKINNSKKDHKGDSVSDINAPASLIEKSRGGVDLREHKFKAVVGIDIGETTVKLVHVDENQLITCMDLLELPKSDGTKMGVSEIDSLKNNDSIINGQKTNSPKAKNSNTRSRDVTNSITTLLERNNITTRRAVISQSNQHATVKIAQLPKLSKSDTLKALSFEVRKILPNTDTKNIHINNIVLEEESDHNGPKVLLILTDKNKNTEIAKSVIKAKIEPIAIDVDALSIARFYQNVYEANSDEVTVLIEVRTTSTLLTFMKGDKFVWSKHISIGGIDFTTHIADTTMVDMVQAEKLKRDEWNSENRGKGKKTEVARAMQPVFERLTTEIRRMIQFFITKNGKQVISRLILGGASSKMSNLAKNLSQRLHVPVARWEIKDFFDTSHVAGDITEFNDKLPHFASVIGLCFWDKESDLVNLMPGKIALRKPSTFFSSLKKTEKAKIISPPKFSLSFDSYLIGFAAVFVFLSITGFLFVTYDDLDTQLTHYRNELTAMNEVEVRINTLKKERSQVAALRESVNKLQDKQIYLAKPLAILANSMTSQINPTELKMDDGLFSLSGYSKNAYSLDKFINSIIETGRFSDIEVGVIRKSDNYNDTRKYFKILFRLN